ncbi:protein kinase [Nonomuraea sp. NPDC050556]|uniref:serine/threonine-protein kinase n=1 Tax=Nonomuraea sp. NPDC050556 TaxID=3364369 RepID=UPI0037ACFD8B
MQSLGPQDPSQLGGHRLVGVLGRGGQGSVYLGETQDGARVAIKMLHDQVALGQDAHRRFLREADAARRVAPFSTARVLDVGIADERPFLVSEFISGPSLDELVRREGPRSGSGLVRLAVSTLTALAAIHRAGIVHRDFKPSNVIMGPEGPVVIDFGIARALDHTTTHGVLGTPAFMAPEQFEGAQLSAAADVFSWAITMVFAASGRPAFAGDSMPALMHAIMTRAPDLSGVPVELRELLAACLAKAPADRPTTASLLATLTGDHPPPAQNRTAPETRAYTRHDSGPHHPTDPRQSGGHHQPGYQQSGPQQSGPQQPGYQQPGYQQPGYRQPTRKPSGVEALEAVPSGPAVAAMALAGLAALAGLIHVLVILRGLVTDDYTAFLDWNGWETVRLGALSLFATALCIALWRARRAAALVALAAVPALVLHAGWAYVFDANPELPGMAVGVLSGVVQSAMFVALGALTWRWSKVGGAIALLVGAGLVVENLLWSVLVLSGFDKQWAFKALDLGTGLNRALVAAWLVALALLLGRAVRARARRTP